MLTTLPMKRADPETLRRLRRRKRKGLSLHDKAITVKTRIRYFVAVAAVLPLLEKTTRDLDEFLVDWIDAEYHAPFPPME